MKIIVASTNPTKIQATDKGFRSVFSQKEIEIAGVSAPSGVSDQPMNDQETYQGALNRAYRIKKAHPEADFWVGIEGGLEQNKQKGFDAFAWVVIFSKYQQGQARTASFSLPPKVADLISQGYELGHADDIVFKQANTKQKSGAVGLLTKNVIDRENLYAPAVTLALIPFINKELYDEKIPAFDKTG